MLYFLNNTKLFDNKPYPFNKQIFILEGPDACGKTTVAKEIQQVIGFPIYHLTYFSDPKKMQAQYDYIEQFLKNWLYDKGDLDGVIIDRFFISNSVYQTVFQNGPIVSNEKSTLDFLTNEQRFARANADITFINCLPEDKERWLNHFKKMKEEREELYTDLNKMSKVYDLYKIQFEQYANKFDLPFANHEHFNIRTLTFDLFHQIDMDKEFEPIDIDMKDIIK